MGQVVAIHLAARARQAMQEVPTVMLVANQGMVGDRYFGRRAKLNVTLVQEEFLTAAASALGVPYRPGMSRRNLTVRGVTLNDWLGKRFTIGVVELEGVSLCEPCQNMEKSIGLGAIAALTGHCGIRARVVRGGVISKGDEIVCI